MSEATFDHVRSISAEILKVPAEQITWESSPKTVESWDSVTHLSLILALEEHFGLSFEPEDIEGMKNLGDFVTAVQNKLGVRTEEDQKT